MPPSMSSLRATVLEKLAREVLRKLRLVRTRHADLDGRYKAPALLPRACSRPISRSFVSYS